MLQQSITSTAEKGKSWSISHWGGKVINRWCWDVLNAFVLQASLKRRIAKSHLVTRKMSSTRTYVQSRKKRQLVPEMALPSSFGTSGWLFSGSTDLKPSSTLPHLFTAFLLSWPVFMGTAWHVFSSRSWSILGVSHCIPVSPSHHLSRTICFCPWALNTVRVLFLKQLCDCLQMRIWSILEDRSSFLETRITNK